MSEAVATPFPEQIVAIGDQMAALKPEDARSLLDYLKDTYKIEPVGGSDSAIQVAGPVTPVEEEQAIFDVWIKSVDPTKKVSAIKVVRAATGLGLKESKDVVDGAPKLVKDALPKAESDKLKKDLEEAGCVVELK